MAATQKKPPASRSRGTSTKPRAAASARSAKSVRSGGPPIRREVGAIVCLFLAFFAAFGYFHIDALFITLFCTLLKGLFGYGFWLAPPLLLLAAYILAFHRGRPVRLRLWCALCLPALTGAVLHLFLAAETYAWSWSMLTALWTDGLALTSGGAVSGLIAVSFEQVFSGIGAAVVFLLGWLLMLLTALNRNVVELVDALRNRPRREYEPAPVPEKPVRQAAEKPTRQTPAPETAPGRDRAAAVDIPVDDGPLVGASAEPALPPKEKRKGFFDRHRRVPMPDEVLSGAASHPIPSEAEQEDDPISDPAPEPVPVPPIDITREPAVPKVKAAEAAKAAREVTREIEAAAAQEAQAYQYPPLSLLREGSGPVGAEALGELRINQERLSETIRSFGIEANICGIVRGPSVTRYELELEQGVRLNRLTNLADDIALSLGAVGVRIAPIPDRISMVGIEVPNKMVSPVNIHEVIGSKEFCDNPSKVSFAVGKDIGGSSIVGNIAKLPHLLIAGTTGSGKSVCTNSLIISLLYKSTPDEVRLIMVDPKMVELSIYNGIPHLLIPVVTDPKKAAGALQWAVTEMMKRYRTFSEVGARDLAAYNAAAAKREDLDKLPQIVVVIDELADLMLVAAREVEESICRVAQMGRAAGMHLVIATQRPSADVITGLMKANIPSRIAFAVSSALESRIILDTQGADKLVGRGDMLWFPLGNGKPLRVQGCLISDEEVAAVAEFVKRSGTAEYDEEVLFEIEQNAEAKEKQGKGVGGPSGGDEGDYDELLPAAIEVVLESGQASVSMLQRRLKLGYGRAARLVDQMEEKGIVGPFEGSKARQLLITKDMWREMQYKNGMPSPPPLFDDGGGDDDGDNEDDDLPPFDLG